MNEGPWSFTPYCEMEYNKKVEYHESNCGEQLIQDNQLRYILAFFLSQPSFYNFLHYIPLFNLPCPSSPSFIRTTHLLTTLFYSFSHSTYSPILPKDQWQDSNPDLHSYHCAEINMDIKCNTLSCIIKYRYDIKCIRIRGEMLLFRMKYYPTICSESVNT